MAAQITDETPWKNKFEIYLSIETYYQYYGLLVLGKKVAITFFMM
jgi:hypothetical protein